MKRSFAWWQVILVYIVFFPAGLWMLIRKMNVEKEAYGKNAKAMRIFGWVLLAAGVIYVLGAAAGQVETKPDNDPGIAMAMAVLVYIGGGLFMVIRSRRYAALAREAAAGQKAAGRGQESHGSREAPGQAGGQGQDGVGTEDGEPRSGAVAGQKVVKCPYCGAVNVTTEGTAAKCEYCGLPLEG